jgi:NRAMP (natural resistance-associated macrophage protein)-like metal ion transporter
MVEATRTEMKQPERPPLLAVLGPGLITGASDDDPSGIATYSQVGAQYGYGMGWMLLFSYPLMCAIQEISARIGRVTGHGVAGNLRRHSPAWLLYGVIGLLFTANTINLGADLGAMAAALKLLIGGPALVYVVAFGAASALLEIFVRYSRYARVLKWLSLSLFAYVATVFIVHVPWGQAIGAVLLPAPQMTHDYVTGMVAVLGTTISPYLFFWQAEQEVEEEQESPVKQPLIRAPRQAPAELIRIRWDTYAGMAFSNLIALFIVITTAATLHAKGVTDVATSAQAAEALRPVAGPFAFAVFAFGIIGTGLLALPVLAGSAAYALGEALRWPVGLARAPGKARRFYAAIAVATVIGVLLNMSPIDPIKALIWSAVINGLVAVPVMVVMMRLACRPAVMGNFVIGRGLRVMGWLSTVAMALAAAGLLVTW